MMGTALTLADLNTTVNHEPRIAHQRLAEALGYGAQIKMKHLVERHIEALQRFGGVSSTVDETGPKGGRPGKTYWLNKKQALYLCTKSETADATEVTIQMVEVFDAYLKGELKPVKVKAHRRALPQPGGALSSSDLPQSPKLPFDLTLASELYQAIVSANVRVERGIAPDFGKALEGVLSDIVTRHYGGDPAFGRVLMGQPLHRERAEWAQPLLGKN
ncbi:hypothetical protein [Xanthobacter sp. ZOL 2024]